MKNKDQSGLVELAKYFSNLDRTLLSRKRAFTFSSGTFVQPPSKLTTSLIETRKRYRFIDDCFRVDVVDFRAPKSAYRHFALSILAVVFCPELPELEIQLTHQQSDVKLIKIAYPGTTPRAVYKYLTAPQSFEYHPESLEENPWKGSLPERDLPDFRLQYQGSRGWEHWDERDMIAGLGNDAASVRLASMLLNFGHPTNDLTTVGLETPASYGGVSKLSAEVHFHLPRSPRWRVGI
jgi:hypothetical protein